MANTHTHTHTQSVPRLDTTLMTAFQTAATCMARPRKQSVACVKRQAVHVGAAGTVPCPPQRVCVCVCVHASSLTAPRRGPLSRRIHLRVELPANRSIRTAPITPQLCPTHTLAITRVVGQVTGAVLASVALRGRAVGVAAA